MITKADHPEWFRALRSSNVEEILHWLEQGRDPDEPIFLDESSCVSPPLFFVYEPDALRVLLEAGADPNRPEELPPQPRTDWFYNQSLPLTHAAGTQNAEMVQSLLDAGAEIDEKLDCLWRSILVIDRPKGHEVVRLLLDQVTDADVKRVEASLLWVAAGNDKCKGVLTDLVERGADPNAPFRGTLPLQQAVEEGNVRAVRELLDAGADPGRGVPGSDQADHELSAVELARKRRKRKILALLEDGP